MIVVVLIVRALFLHRLPKAAFMALWLVVLVRLLVPVSIPAPANVWSMIENGLMNAGIEAAATPEEPVDAAAEPSDVSVNAFLANSTNEPAPIAPSKRRRFRQRKPAASG